MAEIEDGVQVEETKEDTAPKGRAGVLAMWHTQNPEAGREPTDEELWELAQTNFETKNGQRKDLISANVGLSEATQRDPKFGGMLGLMLGEEKKPFSYAAGRMYGKDALNDDEDFLQGVQEYNDAQSKSQAEAEQASQNFQESMQRFEKFVGDKQLTEEQREILYGGIVDLAESFLNGNIPDNIFDLIHKGLNYEQDVEEAIATGEAAGRNQKIETKVKKKETKPSDMVDLGGGSDVSAANRQKGVAPSSSNFFGGFPGKR